MNMTALAIENPRAAAPCPPWCGKPAGHSYEMSNCHVKGDLGRFHRATVARLADAPFGDFDETGIAEVSIAGVGYAFSDSNPVEFTQDGFAIDVTLEVDGEDFCINGLTADQARELAHFLHGALLTAANRLDGITEAQ